MTPDSARRLPVRRFTWSGYAWVRVMTLLTVALTFASSISNAMIRKPLSQAQYNEFLQHSSLMILLLAPVVIEFVFRGGLLGQLRKATGLWPAMVGSAFASAILGPLLQDRPAPLLAGE